MKTFAHSDRFYEDSQFTLSASASTTAVKRTRLKALTWF